MSKALKILERAICDAGYWQWWTRTETAFQIEFGWVMLLIRSEDASQPPSHTIALRFANPRCIVALQRDTESRGLPDDWFARLGRDDIEPLHVCEGGFTLTSFGELRTMYEAAEQREFFLGTVDDVGNVSKDEAFLAFWAGNAGLLIVGKNWTFAISG